MILPSIPQLQELLELASAGDVMAIREYAQLLEENNAAFKTFAGRLINMADTFRIAALQEFVEQCLETS